MHYCLGEILYRVFSMAIISKTLTIQYKIKIIQLYLIKWQCNPRLTHIHTLWNLHIIIEDIIKTQGSFVLKKKKFLSN